jgi:hypothetical protein
MHEFCELVQHTTAFTLNALETAWQATTDELQSSAETQLVKALQIVQLQKAISAVGMLAMFDAEIQERLQCRDGFSEANQRLDTAGNGELRDLFLKLQQAVNVLKHGRGRSYDSLVAVAATLLFHVKLPDEAFFNEGDVSEISALIEVDDKFVLLCVDVISQVSSALNINNQIGA